MPIELDGGATPVRNIKTIKGRATFVLHNHTGIPMLDLHIEITGTGEKIVDVTGWEVLPPSAPDSAFDLVYLGGKEAGSPPVDRFDLDFGPHPVQSCKSLRIDLKFTDNLPPGAAVEFTPTTKDQQGNALPIHGKP